MVSLVQEFQPSPCMNWVWLQFFHKLHAKLRPTHTQRTGGNTQEKGGQGGTTSIMRRWKHGVGFSYSLGIGAPPSSQLSAAQAQFEVRPGCLRARRKSDPPMRTRVPDAEFPLVGDEYHFDLNSTTTLQICSAENHHKETVRIWRQFQRHPNDSRCSYPILITVALQDLWGSTVLQLKKLMTSSGWTLCLPR